jgi:twitching motility two-component system response regulator PilH
VLIIEDLRDQAELCADVCSEAGLNSMTASTGIAGYRRACDSQPAAIILDLVLPDVDGWEVCRRLKTDARTRQIPIVMLTAREEPQGTSRAKEAGCAAFLRKPCPPSDLITVLKSVLQDQEVT